MPYKEGMDWKTTTELVPYEDGVRLMEQRVGAIRAGSADEQVWFLQHPPLYTAGTSAKLKDLIDDRFPVYQSGRGGEYTYHGPGQRVAYVILNLKKRQQTPDIKKYVHDLEEWVIRTLGEFDIGAGRRDGRVGVWVKTRAGDKKIAAIGVRIRHWITYHGVAVNVSPDLQHYDGIIPCGISEYGVTSITELCGRTVTLDEFDEVFKRVWGEIF